MEFLQALRCIASWVINIQPSIQDTPNKFQPLSTQDVDFNMEKENSNWKQDSIFMYQRAASSLLPSSKSGPVKVFSICRLESVERSRATRGLSVGTVFELVEILRGNSPRHVLSMQARHNHSLKYADSCVT